MYVCMSARLYVYLGNALSYGDFIMFWGFHGQSSDFLTFVVLKHVYIPLLFFSGVDYIDAPTPYMMGLHSGVDTYGLTMDGVSSLNAYNLI